MKLQSPIRRGRKGGFTLVEVLLALALSGLLLVAATSLLITLSRAWADRPAARDAFDAHVDGVARFLVTIMDKATMSPKNTEAKSPIFLDQPVGFSDADDPLISFFVREAPPLLVWPRGLAPRVQKWTENFGDPGRGRPDFRQFSGFFPK